MAGIYIGVFKNTVTDEDLLAFFVTNGASVTDPKVLRDDFSGKSRRQGRATASDPASVVLACDGKLLQGFPVTVRAL